MRTKTSALNVKAVGESDGLEDGQFEAIVSVFGNEDSYGDIVLPGAFKDTLAAWEAKGDPIPVIWSHDWRDPFSHLGYTLKAEERENGLWVRSQLDLDNEKAAQVYKLLKGRRVTQFSFAYDIVEGAWVETENSYYYELRKLDLLEVGPCLVGANRETELLAVKAHELAERIKRSDNINIDELKSAYDALGALISTATVLSSKGETNPKQETGQPNPGTSANEPAAPGSSAEQKTVVTPAQVAAWTTVTQLEGTLL